MDSKKKPIQIAPDLNRENSIIASLNNYANKRLPDYEAANRGDQYRQMAAGMRRYLPGLENDQCETFENHFVKMFAQNQPNGGVLVSQRYIDPSQIQYQVDANYKVPAYAVNQFPPGDNHPYMPMPYHAQPTVPQVPNQPYLNIDGQYHQQPSPYYPATYPNVGQYPQYQYQPDRKSVV